MNELSDSFDRLRAMSAEASAEVDVIEALLRDCWIDSYDRNSGRRTDTCRCSLGDEWAPFDSEMNARSH